MKCKDFFLYKLTFLHLSSIHHTHHKEWKNYTQKLTFVGKANLNVCTCVPEHNLKSNPRQSTPMIAASCRSITGCDLISTARYYVQCTTLSLIFNVNEVPMRNVKKHYLYWNGLAPPTEWFQSLCYLVSTSSQARYYVRWGMRNDVWPRFPVFFYLYFGLQGVRNDASVQECTMANLQLHKILYCRISHISSGYKKSIFSEFKNRVLKVKKNWKKSTCTKRMYPTSV
jgi:hypothetical protein